MEVIKYSTVLDSDGLCTLVKKDTLEYSCDSAFNTPADVYNMMCTVFELQKQTEEYVYLLCFNTAQMLLGVFELSHGSVCFAPCRPREVFQKALLCNACSIILIHNHPSGNATPSDLDKQLCKNIETIAGIMGIPLLDFIIAGNNYCSFMELNMLLKEDK